MRVAVDEPDNAAGLLAEGVARRVNEIAADVHQAAAAPLHLAANVAGIVVEVAVNAGDGAQFADAPFVEQRADSLPLRMAVDHEGLGDLDAGAGTYSEKRLRFGSGQAERLFAQHVLAGLGGLDRPWNVQV